jgi:S-formylglutathione hydrolase FrmB
MVHSPGLEHNLLGDPADQPAAVYLPDAYRKEPQRRFPVLYFLHGYSDRTPRHVAGQMVASAMDRDIAAGIAQPMIVVLPNGINKYRGSFYANSASTGNWDDYVTRDVVGYIDAHYRTIPTPAARGIAGHSMGGYGALTLAFRHPGVFSAVYAMSPCCTDIVADFGPSNDAWVAVNRLKSPDEIPTALDQNHFFVAALGAIDAALAPDPHAGALGDPAFVLDGKHLRTDPSAFSRIASNMPVNMVIPLLANIMQLRGIFIEYGAQDNFAHIPIGAQELSQKLSQAGVTHSLEVFQGDHGDHLEERLTNHLLPWMSRQLTTGK